MCQMNTGGSRHELEEHFGGYGQPGRGTRGLFAGAHVTY